MRAIGSLRLRQVELAWAVFAGLNLEAMVLWPRWETIPFHLIWFTLTLLYGFAVWRPRSTALVLSGVGFSTGVLILSDAMHGSQVWGELFEVPLMSAMFLAMVWHARRRKEAMEELAVVAEERASLLDRQESFMQDVSHALRTPITIARGHLEIAQRGAGAGAELDVAIDELGRMERIVARLLLIAKAQAASLGQTEVELDLLLEDVAMRWSDVSPRVWRVGQLAEGTLRADPDALRAALDALVENAVQHTEPTAVIELSSRANAGEVTIEVADEGRGIPSDALGGIFDRFAQGESGGNGCVGLGLSIVDAIARAHGGRCTVSSSPRGSRFALVLPGFRPAATNLPGPELTAMLPIASSPDEL
ncbi:MAG: two-component system, OmpR family, sensor kinase [Thermoleophilaceae bacterium]|jgi:signal transduction histidine kinase|nr:two-component system, OmpR family, sensor kinase [Thermoleophilaceae bacterium]